MDFYLIRSANSKVEKQGLRKFSLASDSDAEIHLFIWVNQVEAAEYIQLVFHNHMIEWRGPTGFQCQSIGRDASPFPLTRQSDDNQDADLLQAGISLLQAAQLPEPFMSLLSKVLAL